MFVLLYVCDTICMCYYTYVILYVCVICMYYVYGCRRHQYCWCLTEYCVTSRHIVKKKMYCNVTSHCDVTHVHKCAHTCTQARTHTRVHMHIHTCTYICTSAHTYTHAHTHTYTHTLAHTHTRMHACRQTVCARK